MAEGGDGEPMAGSSGTLRPSFSLGRGLAGRSLLNSPPPGRLTSLRSRDLTLGGYKKVPDLFILNQHASVCIMLYELYCGDLVLKFI